MADDLNPTFPTPDSSHVQPAPSAAPPVIQENVPTAPAAPPEPTFSLADFMKGLVRSAYYVLVGAVVGAVAGFVLNYILVWANVWAGDVRLVTAAGLLFGVFFNRTLVQTLRLVPRKEVEARVAARAGKAQPADGPAPDSFREIVETVVFVVVLVLLLKSFDAEAFVIPTGSMAETLLGYQKWAVCPKCGYRFPVNCSQQVDPTPPGATDWIQGCICPNCREHIHFTPNAARTNDPDAIPDPSWSSGDRVLVSKFVYDLFESPPDRLDVVVFKYPGDSEFPLTGPFRDGVPMNYIKRLVGLSGETIAIHNGDLYALEAPNAKMIAEAKAASQNPDAWHDDLLRRYNRIAYFDLDKVPEAERAELAKQLWEKRHMHVNEQEAKNLFDAGAFTIVRKSPDNILAMRRIVYDADHPAKDLADLTPSRWAARGPAGWASDGKNGFRLAAASDDAIQWLGYRHLLRDDEMEYKVRARKKLRELLGREPTEDEMRDDNLARMLHGDPAPRDAVLAELRAAYAKEGPSLITDFMGYNTWEGQHSPHGPPGENWVGDLILDADVQADQPKGELTLELSKGVDRFRARFDLATGDCKLLRVTNAGKTGETEEELDHKPTALKGGKHAVRFANVDQRLTVWVDDSLPFGDGVVYNAPETAGPTEANDLAPAAVGVKGTAATVTGLKLWRDTYYTTAQGGNPGAPDGGYGVRYREPSTWGPLDHLPTKTIYVQPDHYLCMGDNSPESSDGRSWGLVPNRLLLGKALAVYYPFDRFGRIR